MSVAIFKIYIDGIKRRTIDWRVSGTSGNIDFRPSSSVQQQNKMEVFDVCVALS